MLYLKSASTKVLTYIINDTENLQDCCSSSRQKAHSLKKYSGAEKLQENLHNPVDFLHLFFFFFRRFEMKRRPTVVLPMQPQTVQPFPHFPFCPSALAWRGGLFKKQLEGYTEPFAGSRPCRAGQSAGVPFTTDL